MERNGEKVRTVGNVRVEILESPHVLSLKPTTDPQRELVPGVLQPTERRWLAGMVKEILHAYDRFSAEQSTPLHFPDRDDLALPKPDGLHPIDHFGRAWNVFMQTAELMGATIFFCDSAGREIGDGHLPRIPQLSLCLRFQ